MSVESGNGSSVGFYHVEKHTRFPLFNVVLASQINTLFRRVITVRDPVSLPTIHASLASKYPYC
jgi:hypothetical protein